MSETDAQAPDGAGLSIDEAVELVTDPAEAPPSGGLTEDAEPSEHEAADDGADGEFDTDPGAGPPPFWAAEDKAWFAEQPPEVREKLLAYERNRDAATSRALQEAALARKAAQAEAASLADYRSAIEEITAEAHDAFEAGAWEEVDWLAWAEEDPQAAFRGKLQYEAEREQLQRLDAAKQVAEEQAFRHYVAEQAQALSALAPELAHDDGRRREVGAYLAEQGYPHEVLRGVGALDLVIAHKAMLWDRANATLNQPRRPEAAGRAVRPGAAAHTPSARRAAEEAKSRFTSSRSREDAIRLLNIRGR